MQHNACNQKSRLKVEDWSEEKMYILLSYRCFCVNSNVVSRILYTMSFGANIVVFLQTALRASSASTTTNTSSHISRVRSLLHAPPLYEKQITGKGLCQHCMLANMTKFTRRKPRALCM